MLVFCASILESTPFWQDVLQNRGRPNAMPKNIQIILGPKLHWKITLFTCVRHWLVTAQKLSLLVYSTINKTNPWLGAHLCHRRFCPWGPSPGSPARCPGSWGGPTLAQCPPHRRPPPSRRRSPASHSGPCHRARFLWPAKCKQVTESVFFSSTRGGFGCFPLGSAPQKTVSTITKSSKPQFNWTWIVHQQKPKLLPLIEMTMLPNAAS